MNQEPNGQRPQGPPWMNVNPGLIIQDLSQQVATQAVEMAAMRAYIEGLHKTLGRATIESQTEDANGAMVSARDT